MFYIILNSIWKWCKQTPKYWRPSGYLDKNPFTLLELFFTWQVKLGGGIPFFQTKLWIMYFLWWHDFSLSLFTPPKLHFLTQPLIFEFWHMYFVQRVNYEFRFGVLFKLMLGWFLTSNSSKVKIEQNRKWNQLNKWGVQFPQTPL